MISFPGPTSVLITLPVPPDHDGVCRVLALERSVRDALPELRETIPAFNRLLVEGAPAGWDPDDLSIRLTALAEKALRDPVSSPDTELVTLPTCYDPDLAPDLAEVARTCEVETADVVRLHSGGQYTVLATGFAPGFAYLGDLDERIAVPRLPTPRPRVGQGSVGIADRRAGVYPSAGPGGWNLIGRVPPGLFLDATERIARFEPGGRVRFRPIERSDYEAEA